jgi:hypothetical protein
MGNIFFNIPPQTQGKRFWILLLSLKMAGSGEEWKLAGDGSSGDWS